jgi:hypothetical protein
MQGMIDIVIIVNDSDAAPFSYTWAGPTDFAQTSGPLDFVPCCGVFSDIIHEIIMLFFIPVPRRLLKKAMMGNNSTGQAGLHAQK